MATLIGTRRASAMRRWILTRALDALQVQMALQIISAAAQKPGRQTRGRRTSGDFPKDSIAETTGSIIWLVPSHVLCESKAHMSAGPSSCSDQTCLERQITWCDALLQLGQAQLLHCRHLLGLDHGNRHLACSSTSVLERQVTWCDALLQLGQAQLLHCCHLLESVSLWLLMTSHCSEGASTVSPQAEILQMIVNKGSRLRKQPVNDQGLLKVHLDVSLFRTGSAVPALGKNAITIIKTSR